MVIRLVIGYSKLVSVALKREDWEKEWVGVLRGMGAAVLFLFVCLGVSVVIESVCVRDCRCLGLCAVGIVG
jgi:hypothetical protein